VNAAPVSYQSVNGLSDLYQCDGPGSHDLEVGLARLPDPVGHGVADGLEAVHGNHHQHVRTKKTHSKNGLIVLTGQRQ